MKQQGFSLIELVIVVIILGILAVTALPRFLDVTTEAQAANIEGMAGGFATGVSLARAQWEAEGRPKDGTNNVVWYDGSQVYLTVEDRTATPPVSPGYPTSTAAFAGAAMNNARCGEVWNAILQNPASVTSNTGNDSAAVSERNASRYFVQAIDNGTNSNVCAYWLMSTLPKTNDGRDVDVSSLSIAQGNNFVYDPKNGRVTININITN